MAGFSRNLSISYGFFTSNVRLTSSKVSGVDDDLTQLCTGSGSHDPAKPCWDPVCPSCGAVERTSLVKGREIAKDTYAVFSADEIAGLKADDAQYKTAVTLSCHDAVEVERQTMPSGTTYYLEPGKGDVFFGLLQRVIAESPDKAFLGLYTVTSRAGLYRWRAYGNGLVAEKLLRPEEVKPAPEINATPVPDAMLETALEVADKFVTPFDPATYRNTYREALEAATAARAADATAAIVAGTGAPSTPAVDPMAAMAAQMQAFLSDKAEDEPAKSKATRTRKKVTAA